MESGAQSSAPTAAAVYYDIGGDEAAPDEGDFELSPRWVMAIGAKYQEALPQNQDDLQELVLYDSGSDENVCPYAWGTDEYDHGSEIILRTVAGELLSRGGQRRLQFEVETVSGKVVTVEGILQVSESCVKPVVSAGKFMKKGFTAQLGNGGGYVWHPDGLHFQLHVRGNATYFWVSNVRALPAKEAEERRHGSGPRVAAPVEQEPGQEAWEMARQEPAGEAEEAEEDVIQIGGDINFERRGRSKLTPFDKVEKLKARLKELGQPRYGNKAQLWHRLEKPRRSTKGPSGSTRRDRNGCEKGRRKRPRPLQGHRTLLRSSGPSMSSRTFRPSRGASTASKDGPSTRPIA